MFSGSTQGVRRFSLLLLEEGELYVEDFVASARWPAGVAGNWQRLPHMKGQLRLCTKSLFWEPDDVRVPIVRLPFQFVEGMEGAGERRLLVTTTRVVKMRGNAADTPYVVERAGNGSAPHPQPLQWEFELSYARLEGVMPLAQQMMVASRLPAAEQEEFLQATMAAAEAGARFDLGGLRSPAERLLLELGATLLSQGALVREPGRLLVTDQRLYFQPLHNISGHAAVSSHPLTAVAAVARRRYSLRDLALEVFFSQPDSSRKQLEVAASPPFWGAASALFAFSSREQREQAVAVLAAQQDLGAALPGGREAATACSAILEADPSWLSRVTAAWQRGLLSNLDYLLFLNLASGRTFNDLSQYPVMPWVLADYASPALDLSSPQTFRDLSLPVGALNPRRLAMLRERFADMAGFSAEPPFLYGSHYSTPGFTMFWLVRAAPAHLLRLQAGRFDSPDRLFCGVGEAWEGVTGSNPGDVKELIPEFYTRHDFLLNSRNLGLGTRQNGQPVGDVHLPPWAASPSHFQAVLRAALEAPFVSANLHHWADLIFGCKQRGEAALEAHNVFRHTAYEGAVDIDGVADRTERIALETQIAEFGQCPRQLFTHRHPQRLVCPPSEVPPPDAAAAQGGGGAAAGASSQALPLALVATILAATREGAGDSPRLEVPRQLAELDVAALRQRRQEEEAAARAAAAAAGEDAEHADGATAVSGSQANAARSGADHMPSHHAAASPASGRLRSLGAWAAERKQAVGDRLAGSVGAVRDALAMPAASGASDDAAVAASGGSASRLQSLFNRRGPAPAAVSASSPATSAAAASEAAGGWSSSAAAPSTTARSPSKSPVAGGAAGLVSSISGRLASFSLPRGQAPGSPALDSEGSVQVASSSQQPLSSAAAAAETAVAGRQPADSSSGSGTVWKFARQAAVGGRSAGSRRSSEQGGTSSDEEEHDGPPPPQQHLPPLRSSGSGDGGSGIVRRSGSGRSAAELLEAQRQRMLSHGRGDTATPAASSSPAAAAGSRYRTGWYGAGLRDRLAAVSVLAAGSESINGCALAAVGDQQQQQYAYSASHSGWLRVHRLHGGEQVRASSISEQPLTSVALLAAPGGGGSGGGPGGLVHPLVLCGSFDACVHAYSPASGRCVGSFQAAADAVACVQLVGGGGGGGGSGGSSCRLLTASWDGTLRGWELAEGRQPWASTLPQPAWSVQAPSAVWAVAAAPDGGLVLAGTEDGLVASYDPRQPPSSRPLWSRHLLADNYIGGLELCPSGTAAVVAAADGSLSLLDLRHSGAVVARVVPSGAPLRCCSTDGVLALAGDERGALHVWHVAQQLDGGQGAAPLGSWTAPQPDGLFSSLAPHLSCEGAAVNSLAVMPSVCGGGVDVLTGHENGQLSWLSTVAGRAE